MKFIVSSKVLLKAIEKPNKALASNPIVPILENLAFQVNKSQLLITGCDNNTIIQGQIEVESNDEFGFCIPAKLLTNYLSLTPDQPIIFEYFDKYVLLHIKSGKTKISTEKIEDYPFINKKQLFNDEPIVINNGTDFIKNINKSLKFVIEDDVTEKLNGLLIEFYNDSYNCVCADGNSIIIANGKILNSTEVNFYIFYKNAYKLASCLSDADEFKIYYNKNAIKFVAGSFTFHTTLKENKFPLYRSVIAKNDKELEFKRLELSNIIARCQLSADEVRDKKACKLGFLTIKSNQLFISTIDTSYENESTESMDVDCDFSFEGTINITHLKRAMDTFESNSLILKVGEHNQIQLFNPQNENDFFSSMMVA